MLAILEAPTIWSTVPWAQGAGVAQHEDQLRIQSADRELEAAHDAALGLSNHISQKSLGQGSQGNPIRPIRDHSGLQYWGL